MRLLCAFSLILCLGCNFDSSGTSGTGDPGEADAARVSNDAGAVPGDPTFSRQIDITDTQVIGGPHASFPLLVSLSENWLRDIGSGGNVAHSNGFDISFSADAAKTAQLEHEIESYDAGTGELIAWIRIPMLSASTTLYINYGDPDIDTSLENASAVWNQEYAGVWHLRGDIVDSTANNSPGTNSGSSEATGWIGAGRQFDAVNDFIDVGSDTGLDNLFVGGGTAEAWFNASNWGENAYGRIFDKGHLSGWSMFVDDNSAPEAFTFYHGTDAGAAYWTTDPQSISLDSWHHVAVIYDKGSTTNDPVILLDGQSIAVNETVGPSGAAVSDASQQLFIGNRPSNDRTFDGTLDEARLSTVPRSPGWIATSYRNQVDPGGFYQIGPELP